MSLFFRAKLSYIFLTFILTNSIMTVKLRKSVRSASYLTIHPRPFSPLQWSNLVIFLLSPGYSSIFSQLSPAIQYLSTRWAILLASFSQPPTQYLLTGWVFFSVIQPSPKFENQDRLTQIHLHSPRRQMGARGHCWYQSSGSSWSPVKGRKSTLGPLVVAITVN